MQNSLCLPMKGNLTRYSYFGHMWRHPFRSFSPTSLCVPGLHSFFHQKTSSEASRLFPLTKSILPQNFTLNTVRHYYRENREEHVGYSKETSSQLNALIENVERVIIPNLKISLFETEAEADISEDGDEGEHVSNLLRDIPDNLQHGNKKVSQELGVRERRLLIEKFTTGVFRIDSELAHQYEYIGLSVLNLCVADYLFAHFPNLNLQQLRASLIMFTTTGSLSDVSREELKIHKILQVTEPNNQEDTEKMTNAQYNPIIVDKTKLSQFLRDCFIRIVGFIYCIYEDRFVEIPKNSNIEGLYQAREFIARHVLKNSIDISPYLESFDPRAELRRLVASGRFGDYTSEDLEFVSEKIGKTSTVKTKALLGRHTTIGESIGITTEIAQQKASQDALNQYYSKYVDVPSPIQKNHFLQAKASMTSVKE